MTSTRSDELYARMEVVARGEDPNLIAELRSGYAVLSDAQQLPGYCVLIHRRRCEHLDDLDDEERIEFLLDLSLLGEAVRTVISAQDPAFRRMNYEVLGNTWPQLHGHVHARYWWEAEEYRGDPVWCYPNRNDPQHRLGDQHEALRAKIASALDEITQRAYARG